MVRRVARPPGIDAVAVVVARPGHPPVRWERWDGLRVPAACGPAAQAPPWAEGVRARRPGGILTGQVGGARGVAAGAKSAPGPPAAPAPPPPPPPP
ncbi:hypothetical protein MXD58_024385, partial [Frankia sp. AgKG'84/4]|nr:hypothetical protein [Frankia sp. AgKG'84/4]